MGLGAHSRLEGHLATLRAMAAELEADPDRARAMLGLSLRAIAEAIDLEVENVIFEELNPGSQT